MGMMDMFKNMGALQGMKAKMEAMKTEVAAMVISHSSAGQELSVSISGKKEILNVELSEDFALQPAATQATLILNTINEAMRAVDAATVALYQKHMPEMAGMDVADMLKG